jgi:hypothetical protein
MMGSPRLNTKVKGRIVGLCEGDLTPYVIAAKCNIPRSIVCRFLKYFQLHGTTMLPKSPGRPCKLQMITT